MNPSRGKSWVALVLAETVPRELLVGYYLGRMGLRGAREVVVWGLEKAIEKVDQSSGGGGG